ncbi:NAD-dependent epimerase/dehydratase family protein, partial [bacterium]|nr:NAD-dependent epimerase/dehydratase family protein [bacterium]
DIRPDIVFHLAGQVAMTTSIENPALDFDTNAVGTFNLLDGVRKWVPGATVVYSSTNKVYGDLEWIRYEETSFRYTCPDYPMGFDESIPLDFRSPYGCSKGCADQYMLDYARVFGLNTVVFRHSSMYGGRQFSTYDQGWVGWFCQQAVLQTKNNATPFSISGNGKQVRDLLHARDMIDLYFSAVRHIQTARGNVFNIGGTIAHSMSLLELFAWLENRLGVDLNYSVLEPRKSDQKVFVADVRKATELLGWAPKIDMNQGLSEMLEWVSETTI